jgi:hypothetical protein
VLRQALVWIILLGLAQFTDVLTTAADRTRGTIEAMSVSANLLGLGGLGLLWFTKLTLVLALAAAAALASRWVFAGRPGSRLIYGLVLASIQGCAIGLLIVSLNNLALLASV